jgi:cytochrome P450
MLTRQTFRLEAKSVAMRPPGPRGLPLVGNLMDIRRDALGFFTECSHRYGDIVGMRLGTWPAILLNNPHYAESVLVKNHSKFIKHRVFWRHVVALFGNGLLTSEGEFWHRQRRLAAPAFRAERLACYGEVMVRQTSRMLDGWEPGEIRDLHRELLELTYGIAAETLFDSEIKQRAESIQDDVRAVIREIASRIVRPFVIPDCIPLPGHVRYRRVVRRIDRYIRKIIDEQRARPTGSHGLLSMLLSARDESGRPMSDRQLRDEAVTLLLAGHETIALALTWTWYLLAQHPEIDAKVAEEVGRILGGRAATVGDIPHLRFTEQVVMEAMRLYPPAWFFGREALCDFEIGPYIVRKGTTILISPWVLHRDPRFFEAPAQFRPERWGTGMSGRLPRFAYMPFGGGPRVCIGSRFAMTEAILVLATVTQRFRFKWEGEKPIVPLPSITLRPKGGLRMRLVPRRTA